MLYHVSGELAAIEPNFAVIDCGGIGYRLTISANTYSKLSALKEKRARLFTHLMVRDDSLELFGFYDRDELSAFRLLTSVSGVGVKSAVSILSLMTPEKFALAVAMDDTKALSKAPGIGAKTAARVILELKDKIAKGLSLEGGGDGGLSEEAAGGGKLSDAVNTLLVLGYSRPEALTALRGIDPQTDLEDMIKAALKKLIKM